jgi:hypothetical protein
MAHGALAWVGRLAVDEGVPGAGLAVLSRSRRLEVEAPGTPRQAAVRAVVAVVVARVAVVAAMRRPGGRL